MKFERAEEILKKFNQEHVLLAYDRLPEDKREKLLDQVLSIDFNEVNELYEATKEKPRLDNLEITPMPFVDNSKLSDDERKKYIEAGEKIIKNGKYAVAMLAGGQGTRLGHNGPKGTFDLGLDSHKSLFELFADKLKLAKEKYGVIIPWYIMTSRENNDDTVKFFEAHDYFGYREGIENHFFKQNELPMLDTEGKLIIDENNMIKEAANGHGGLFDAMIKNNLVEDMKEKNIEWLFTCGVDNVLAKLVDPLLLGFAKLNGYMVASPSIVKSSPKEKVGVFCHKGSKPGVIEYSEINDEMANAKDDNGEFLYGEAHIMMNLFNIDTINGVAKEKLPYHKAFKKCNYIDKDGSLIIAIEPNAYKFEAFIFDAFGRLDNMGILRYKREECFAPVKNATGDDSPETARKLYKNLYNL